MIRETIMKMQLMRYSDEIEHSSSRNNLTWVIDQRAITAGYYLLAERMIWRSCCAASCFSGMLSDLDEDNVKGKILESTDDCAVLAGA